MNEAVLAPFLELFARGFHLFLLSILIGGLGILLYLTIKKR